MDASPYFPVLMLSNNVKTAIFCPGVIKKITDPAVIIALVKLLTNPVTNAGFKFGNRTSQNTRSLFAPKSLAASSIFRLICASDAVTAFVVIDICLNIILAITIKAVPVSFNGS